MNSKNDFELNMRLPFKDYRDTFVAVGLLLLILVLTYSNSFDCSWHFDDYINIVENPGIQIKSLSWRGIEKGLHGIAGLTRWQRPLPYFTFALNYYFDGLNVFWYHAINFLIHYVTSVFLFLFIYNTLKLPILEKRYERHAYSIALLSTLFWAINPIQVMAVTYIVQRMASMAAMFYIITMYFYLKGRIADRTWKGISFFILAAFSALLSLGSKENAAMLPVSLFLFDLFLIQGATVENIKKNWAVCLFVLVLVPAIGLVYCDFSSIMGSYDEFRPFTVWERLLTQPRVVLFYISLLLYPITSRMMLIHDTEISKSFFDPWTTSAAIVVILLILVLAVFISRKRPLISYCIIFFFINHAIEGSFISLGLVYEHRNYLPSLLFFIPLSVLVVDALDYFEKRKGMVIVLSSVVTAIVIIMGMTVYIQNDILKDEISLWSDNVAKTPQLDIVHNNLGMAFLNSWRLPEAFAELTRATESSTKEHVGVKYMTYKLLGHYYFFVGNDDEALFFAEKSLVSFSSDAELYNLMAAILMKKKRLEEAETMMKKAISLREGAATFHINLGKICLLRKQPDAAIKEAQKAISLDGYHLAAYWLISEAFKAKKDYRTSDHFHFLWSHPELTKKRCQ